MEICVKLRSMFPLRDEIAAREGGDLDSGTLAALSKVDRRGLLNLGLDRVVVGGDPSI
jgi:hypothetical protein